MVYSTITHDKTHTCYKWIVVFFCEWDIDISKLFAHLIQKKQEQECNHNVNSKGQNNQTYCA